MKVFDLDRSLEQARARLGDGHAERRPRRDRGRSRLAAEVRRKIHELLQGYDRPRIRTLLRDLEQFSSAHGHGCPSRATVYEIMASAPVNRYRIASLPAHVRAALYNLAEHGEVPGHQLAFYCFNYGDTASICFAAGLPWLELFQAARMRGWRPGSRGVLEAVLKVRGIRTPGASRKERS